MNLSKGCVKRLESDLAEGLWQEGQEKMERYRIRPCMMVTIDSWSLTRDEWVLGAVGLRSYLS